MTMAKKQANGEPITLPNGKQVSEEELYRRVKKAAAIVDDPNSPPAKVIAATRFILWCGYGDPPTYVP